MKKAETHENGSVNSLLESVQDAIDSVKKATQEAVETINPMLQEAGRLRVNGYQSVEDAVTYGIEVGKEGANSLATIAKEIKANPEEALEHAKSSITKVVEGGKIKALRAKDAAVETYEQRDEILSNVNKWLNYAMKNPREVKDAAKQHGAQFYGGIARGSFDSVKDMYGHLDVGREDFKKLELHLEQQSAEFISLKVAEKQTNFRPANYFNFLDAALVGGDVFQEALTRQIPADILQAFALAYNRKAEHESLREYFLKFHDDERKAAVVAIKGKLFEIQYANYLNDENLPKGYIAVLSASANQPGYDIEIHGPDGHISEVIQAKATDSISYVKHALERYPDIRVVSTSEVHSEIVLRGWAENVTDSGITNSALNSDMLDAGNAADSNFSGPSVLALALLAFTSYSQDGLTAYEKSRQFGDRTGNYAVAYGIGVLAYYGAAACLGDSDSGLKFISMIVASLSRTVISTGRQKYDKLKAMQELVDNNELILSRLRQLKTNEYVRT